MSGAEKILPVVLAGGGGTRLWPLSRDGSPKQFKALTGALSTYQLTLMRVSDPELFLPPLVLTGEGCCPVARQQAREVGITPTIIAEPTRRDSAAAIAVAAVVAEAQGCLVLALAADQLIGDVEGFLDAVDLGSSAARAGSIVVLGVSPDGPLTGYGYIKPGPAISDNDDLCRVEAFVEKPCAERAAGFVASGYLWNSGNFLFRPDAMIRALTEHVPEILAAARGAVDGARLVDGIVALDAKEFSKSPRISIDYAVIEKVRDIAVVRGHFGWSDIGDWTAIAETVERDDKGNAVVGQGLLRDSRDCLIHSEHVLTAAVGVTGLAIVATPDGVLVMAKDRAQDVKAVVEEMKARRAAGGPQGLDVREFVIGANCRRILRAETELRWMVLSGTAEVSNNGRAWRVGAGDSFAGEVPGELTIAAFGDGPVRLLEVRLPAGG